VTWLTTAFSTIRAKLSLWLGFAVIGLALLAKYLVGRNARLKLENKIEKKRNEFARSVMEADRDIEIQSDARLEELENDILSSGISNELEDPNDW